MIKILMVCLGNICRSPLAEGILKSKTKNKILVESAGTGGWHIGELPDSRSIEVANSHLIDITDQRCRKFTYSDFENFDLIYVMDRNNLNDVLNIARFDHEREKVRLILEEVYPNMSKEVPDPYYQGEDGFEIVFQMLDKACDVIARKMVD
jgi:protein-tyrosine phosphatase